MWFALELVEKRFSGFNHLPVGVKILTTVAGIKRTINYKHYITQPVLDVAAEMVDWCKYGVCVKGAFRVIMQQFWLLHGRCPGVAKAMNFLSGTKYKRQRD